MQILIFGFALTSEVKDARIVIMDQARDASSRQIISKIEASRYFEVDKTVRSNQEMKEALKQGDIRLAVIFPANFNYDLAHQNDARIQVIADATDPNNATTLTSYISSIIQDYQADFNKTNNIPYRIVPEIRFLYNPEPRERPIMCWGNGIGVNVGLCNDDCRFHCKRKRNRDHGDPVGFSVQPAKGYCSESGAVFDIVPG